MASSATKIIAIALAIAIGIIVLQPVVLAANDNTGVQSVANDQITADLGNYSDLGGYDVDKSTVVVEDAGGTTTYSQGSDYEVATGNGSIKALSSGTISDGQTLNVSYDYQATGGLTETVIGFVPVMFGVLMMVAASRAIERRM
jgi:hypothetical protein